MIDPVHVFPLRVYYEDTDSGGVVYHSNYLRFAERARTEMLRQKGFDHGALLTKGRMKLAVRRCEAEFLKPARLDDLLEIRTWPKRISGASLWVEQGVYRQGELLVDMKLRVVCVRPDGRPVRVPGDLRSAFTTEMDPSMAVQQSGNRQENGITSS